MKDWGSLADWELIGWHGAIEFGLKHQVLVDLELFNHVAYISTRTIDEGAAKPRPGAGGVWHMAVESVDAATWARHAKLEMADALIAIKLLLDERWPGTIPEQEYVIVSPLQLSYLRHGFVAHKDLPVLSLKSELPSPLFIWKE